MCLGTWFVWAFDWFGQRAKLAMQKMWRSKIEALQRKLAVGKLVSKRDIENVLGNAWLARYEREWLSEQAARKDNGHAWRDKQAIKQHVLNSAIDELDRAENTPEAIAQREILKQKLEKLKAKSKSDW